MELDGWVYLVDRMMMMVVMVRKENTQTGRCPVSNTVYHVSLR